MPPYARGFKRHSGFAGGPPSKKRRTVSGRKTPKKKVRGRVQNKERATIKKHSKTTRKRSKISDYQRLKKDIAEIKQHVAVDKLSTVYSWVDSGSIGGLGDGQIHWVEPHLVGHQLSKFWTQHFVRTTDEIRAIRPSSMMYRLKFMRVNPFTDVSSGQQWPFDIKFKVIVCYWSNLEAFGKSGSIVHTASSDINDISSLPTLHEFFDINTVQNVYNNQYTNLDGAQRLSKAQFQDQYPTGTGHLDPKPFLMEYDIELKHGQVQRTPDATSGLFLDAVDMHIAPMGPLDDGTVTIDMKFDPKLFKCDEMHASSGAVTRMTGIPRISVGIITSFPPQPTYNWYSTTYPSGLPYAAHVEYEAFGRMRADFNVEED